ncbi:hypothetical protein NUW58_g2573 [Xylaria curta]|uniref:Uncharacterized protein n=1 Tax=Xylaria curta TaxID=42375 RepID=A0ACC1PEX4_9PEZI|nr:hypothetical protein NUW58_g2573 [Xylaria curta]
MRFGQNLHNYIILEWDSFYIHYDRLKQLIKTSVVSGNEAVSACRLKESLIEAFSKLHASRIALYLSLTRRHELLLSSHLVQTEPASAATSLSLAFVPDARRYIHAAFSDIQITLERLQWFDRVNHEAVSRLFAKIRMAPNHAGVDPDALFSQWSQMQEVVDAIRVTVKKLMQETVVSFRTYEMPAAPLLGAASQTHGFGDLDSTLVEAITLDSPNVLKDYLDQNQGLQRSFHQALFKVLTFRHSWKCLNILASRFASSLDHHCLAVFFCSLQIPSRPPPDLESVCQVVCTLFTHGHGTIAQALCQGDVMGKSPLHYAMKNGFDISTAIVKTFDERNCRALLLGSMLSKDSQGLTPLHLATIEGHTSVIRHFFDILPPDFRRNKSHEVNAVAAACLCIAITLRSDRLVRKLSPWADTKYISEKGLSLFHLAARAGRHDYMWILISACRSEDLNLNIADSRGRTPLMYAGARGHFLMVEMLLKAGADPSLIDHSAWTARMYAVYRGHLEVAALFPNPTPPPARHLMHSKATLSAESSPSAALAITNSDSSKRTLVIYLGSMQLMDNRSPVLILEASDETSSSWSIPQLYHLELSVNQTNKQRQTINLPPIEDQSSKPFVFHLDADSEPQLLLRLFNDDLTDESGSSLLAAGAILLQSTKSFFGYQRESLIREQTTLLLCPDSQKTIGTVLLTYVIARPFGYLRTQIPMPSLASHESGQMTLVGHRGFGLNSVDRSQLQLGENTIGSFMAAADHGATFVEFGIHLHNNSWAKLRLTMKLDTQVSRDLNTVIYHDFSLSETGTDVPIHDLTIDQYKYASTIQAPHGSPLITPDEQTMVGESAAVRRSRSVDKKKDLGALLIRDRLKYTADFKSKAMKPNIRGDVIQEPLVTLPELFQRLPPKLGFIIEIKYPRLHEARSVGVATVALEINLFVDTVLEQIHQFADQRRPIILSSFTPEICILLSIKQKAFPVLFVSDAGKPHANDLEKRVASFQAGLHFAKRWGLAGLCLASEPLILCPELIRYVKSSGLLCASYGPQNSIPENVLVSVELHLFPQDSPAPKVLSSQCGKVG